MALSGNKGEWSEIYTLFRLLGEGKVHAGDANLNKLDLYYPILNIIRQESKLYEYKPYTKQNIVVIDENGDEYTRISMDKFMEESKSLLDVIKTTSKRTFEIPNTECFMNEIGCTKLKAPSGDKADIHIVIHDLRTNMTPELGFSIKSQLGSPSTLLNAGDATNITYRVVSENMSNEELKAQTKMKPVVVSLSAVQASNTAKHYADELVCKHILAVCSDNNNPIKSTVPVSAYTDIALTDAQKAQLKEAAMRHYGPLFEKLKQQYPKLKEKDFLYCQLCLLGLDNAQIAVLLQNTISTVWERENRLKRIFGTVDKVSVFLFGFMKN